MNKLYSRDALRKLHLTQLSLRRLLAEHNQLFNRHYQYVPKLISQLAAVESAPHIHENRSNLVYLDEISAAKLEAPVKS
jgi:hypothetical protein